MHISVCCFLSSPLKQFENIRTTAQRSTRGGERRDCIILHKRSNFSQSVFSLKAAREWNSVPSIIERLHAFDSFQSRLKKLLTDNSALCILDNIFICTHFSWLVCLFCCHLSLSLSFFSSLLCFG